MEILIESLTSPPVLHIALLPDFVLDLQTTSLIGSTAKLQDIPKIEQLLAARLRAFIVARWVLPRSKAIRLPDLGPGATDNSNTPQPEDDWVEIESGDVPQPLSDSQPAPGYREADADQSAPQLRGHHKPISVAEWRRTQPSFVTPQPAYMPPWAPGSPLFSPNSSLTATSYARPPPSIPKSASEFSLPGQLPNSVRHRRPQQGLSTPNYRVPPSIMQSRQSSANPISRSWPRGGSPTELDEMGG